MRQKWHFVAGGDELGVTSGTGGLSGSGFCIALPSAKGIVNALFSECWPRTSLEFCLLSFINTKNVCIFLLGVQR